MLVWAFAVLMAKGVVMVARVPLWWVFGYVSVCWFISFSGFRWADLFFCLCVVVKGCYRLLLTAQLQIAVFWLLRPFWVADWLSSM